MFLSIDEEQSEERYRLEIPDELPKEVRADAMIGLGAPDERDLKVRVSLKKANLVE